MPLKHSLLLVRPTFFFRSDMIFTYSFYYLAWGPKDVELVSEWATSTAREGRRPLILEHYCYSCYKIVLNMLPSVILSRKSISAKIHRILASLSYCLVNLLSSRQLARH
jgi:hypothetical protein